MKKNANAKAAGLSRAAREASPTSRAESFEDYFSRTTAELFAVRRLLADGIDPAAMSLLIEGRSLADIRAGSDVARPWPLSESILEGFTPSSRDAAAFAHWLLRYGYPAPDPCGPAKAFPVQRWPQPKTRSTRLLKR